MIARLNKSKNSQMVKSNKNSMADYNNQKQSTLYEIHEHLDKIKTPLKKSRSSMSFDKNKK